MSALAANVRHTLVPLQDRATWTASLQGIEHAFAHTWESCHAMQQSSGLPTFLYCLDADDVRVVCPLAERTFDETKDVVTPYGLGGFAATGEHPQFAALWRAFARERGWVCGYIGLNPLVERICFCDPADAAPYQEIFALDLQRDEAELLAVLSENRRRQIRSWQSGPYTLTTDRDALAQFVLAHADEFFASRNASSVYHFAPATWHALARLPNVVLLGAELGGRVVAVTMLACTPPMGDFLFNVSVPEGQDASAPLLWFGALQLRSLGVRVLNLGGGIRPGDGVAQFKQRFGARSVPMRALKQVYDPVRFEELCRRVGADPSSRHGFFPPYHASR